MDTAVGSACIACGTLVSGGPVAANGSLAGASIGSSRSAASAVDIRVCPRCGLGFQAPLPTDEELTALYESLVDEAYTDERGPRALAVSLAVRLLRRYAGSTRGRLLDVGCAAGIFLEEAAKDGWDVAGVEPSAFLRGQASPAVRDRIQAGVFRDVGGAEIYDVVTFWDVLEHVRDVPDTLAHAAKLLRPGGLLMVNVPDRSSVIARAFGRRWPLLLPEHLHYFTPGSLTSLYERAGIIPLGTHLHPVFFRFGYIVHRLSQHVPGLGGLASIAASPLGAVPLPILMGETTMIGRKR